MEDPFTCLLNTPPTFATPISIEIRFSVDISRKPHTIMPKNNEQPKKATAFRNIAPLPSRMQQPPNSLIDRSVWPTRLTNPLLRLQNSEEP
jgi:hypothetical protein